MAHQYSSNAWSHRKVTLNESFLDPGVRGGRPEDKVNFPRLLEVNTIQSIRLKTNF